MTLGSEIAARWFTAPGASGAQVLLDSYMCLWRATTKVISGAEITAVSSRLLEVLYEFRGQPSVREFLANHDFVIEVLCKAHARLVDVFGSRSRPALCVCDDDDEGVRTLFIVVRCPGAAAKAIELLKTFYDDWWLGVDSKIRAIVGVDVEAEPAPAWKLEECGEF